MHASPDSPTFGIAVVDVDGPLARFESSAPAGFGLDAVGGQRLRLLEDVETDPSTVTSFTTPPLIEGDEVLLIAAGNLDSLARESDGLSVIAVGREGALGLVRQDPQLFVIHGSRDAAALEVCTGDTEVAANIMYGGLQTTRVAPDDYEVTIHNYPSGCGSPVFNTNTSPKPTAANTMARSVPCCDARACTRLTWRPGEPSGPKAVSPASAASHAHLPGGSSKIAAPSSSVGALSRKAPLASAIATNTPHAGSLASHTCTASAPSAGGGLRGLVARRGRGGRRGRAPSMLTSSLSKTSPAASARGSTSTPDPPDHVNPPSHAGRFAPVAQVLRSACPGPPVWLPRCAGIRIRSRSRRKPISHVGHPLEKDPCEPEYPAPTEVSEAGAQPRPQPQHHEQPLEQHQARERGELVIVVEHDVGRGMDTANAFLDFTESAFLLVCGCGVETSR